MRVKNLFPFVFAVLAAAAVVTAPTEVLGEVELKTGGVAVDSPTKPSFKVAVSKVSPPVAAAS